MSRTWMVAILALALWFGCGTEKAERDTPIPQSIIDAIQFAREECFKRADARPFLPTIDALIVSHHEEIAAATTTTTDFSLTFADGSITVVGFTLSVTTPEFAYSVEHDTVETAESPGLFRYSSTQEYSPTGLRVDCSADQWRYVSDRRSGSGFFSTWTIEASNATETLTVSIGPGNADDHALNAEYCVEKQCRVAHPANVPEELEPKTLPSSNFFSEEMRQFL